LAGNVHFENDGIVLKRIYRGGVPKVSVSLGSDASMAWVDIFHRMAEASFHLVTGEIQAARANPLLAGMLHYRPANRCNLLVDAPGGDLFSGVALMDGCRSWSAVLAVVLGIAAAIAYHLVIAVTWRYGLAH
jgi:ATP-dependent protease ClpP protease subunit